MEVAIAEREGRRRRVPKVPMHVVLAGESDRAVHLMTEGDDALVRIADGGLGHRHLGRGVETFGKPPDRLVREVAASEKVDGHVGAVMLHRLEAADRLTELLALLRVLD